jgi:hypothetical protein
MLTAASDERLRSGVRSKPGNRNMSVTTKRLFSARRTKQAALHNRIFVRCLR